MPSTLTQTPTFQPTASTAGVASSVVGLQWGDEGKGKAVDLLAADHDAVVRYNGGANAGHSVVVKGERYALHLIPSGILYPGKAAVIGNGVVVDPWKMLDEITGLSARDVDTSGLVVSSRAHAVLPYHQLEDGLREDMLKRSGAASKPDGGATAISEIGTTRRGIGPAYADKVQRASAVRMGDMLRPEVLAEKVGIALALKGPMLRELSASPPEVSVSSMLEKCALIAGRLAPLIKDTTFFVHDMLAAGKRVLFEGANGTLLDVDHGTYPFVTSSNCGTAGIGSGTGIPFSRVSRVMGVMKAYSTRVGSGPMPSELKDAVGDLIRTRGREFGTTTGRPRRVGWLDLVAVRYSVMVNGATEIALTMLDVLAGFDELKVCTGYRLPDGSVTDRFMADAHDLSRATPVFTTLPGFKEEIGSARSMGDLPSNARRYVEFIQESLGIPAALVSVGPDRAQTIFPG